MEKRFKPVPPIGNKLLILKPGEVINVSGLYKGTIWCQAQIMHYGNQIVYECFRSTAMFNLKERDGAIEAIKIECE